MNENDDDRFAMKIFGADSVTGSRRMIAIIVVVCVIAASLAWWFRP